jgi:hypothetical protein
MESCIAAVLRVNAAVIVAGGAFRDSMRRTPRGSGPTRLA